MTYIGPFGALGLRFGLLRGGLSSFKGLGVLKRGDGECRKRMQTTKLFRFLGCCADQISTLSAKT